MIAFTKQLGCNSYKPLFVRLTPELRERVEAEAISRGVTLNAFAVTAIEGLVRACEAEVRTTVEPLRAVGRAS